MDSTKIEHTYEKPIYLVKLFSIFMLLDYFTGILFNMNLLEIISMGKIPSDKVFSIVFCTLIACFVIKVLFGACGKKIFLKYGNYLVYNKKGISRTIDSWLNEAYKANNQYAKDKCNSIKKSIETEVKFFVDIFINIITFAVYFAYSIKTKSTSLVFISEQPIHLILIIGYFIVLGIIIYSLFSKKDKRIIDI